MTHLRHLARWIDRHTLWACTPDAALTGRGRGTR